MDKKDITEQVIVEAFRVKAQSQVPELALCSIKKTEWRKASALWIDAPIKTLANFLWHCSEQLIQSAQACGAANFLVITLNGRLHGPPIEVKKQNGCTKMIAEVISSSGDLAKRVLDSEESNAIADLETGYMRVVSPKIQSTSGRDPWWWECNKQELNAMWRPEELYELNRELMQRGQMLDAVYHAYSWEFQNGLWIKARRAFKAKILQAAVFMGRSSRVTFGVEIVE